MKYLSIPTAAVLILALSHLGLTNALGAHHFWSAKVAWIGAPIGMVIALILTRLPARFGILLSLAGAIIAGATAHYGKLQFAASYAEDRLAGQLWYFGWIATAATATALIALVLYQILASRV